MSVIRIGVIGTGGIFRSLHLPYYEMTKKAKIVAVADVNERSAREIAQRCGVKYWYTDYRDVIEREDVDAVDICTPPSSHRDIAVAAAKNGKHVLVEKPMCRTVREADEMINAANETGVMLQVAYMIRFHPVYLKLKEFLEKKIFGDLHMTYSCQVGWFPPRHPWLFIKEESGGMLVEQAIHTLDEWLWLYGPVVKVYAKTSHIPLGGTYPSLEEAVENNAVLIVDFKEGGVGMLIKSWAAEVTHHGKGLVGSNGSATFDNLELKWKIHGMKNVETYVPEVPDDDTYRTVSPEERKKRYWSYASKGASIEHWLRCIEGEEEPTTDGRVGRKGIEIAEAAYRSSLTGKPIEISV